MTHEAKADIIEILKQWKSMLGVDKQRTDELISEMNRMYVGQEIDETKVEEIKGYLEYLCGIIEYDFGNDNNAIRHSTKPTERIAVYHFASNEFGKTTNLDKAACDFFGKDRTTMVYWRRKSIDMLETKDPVFMKVIERLTMEIAA